jgi:hypothetical protein
VYVDLLLKGASLGLPYARACGFFPSELDLVAGELARKAASGDAVPQVRRFVHRFFFVLSGVTDRSRDWLRVSYPDPTVRVEFVPESPSTVAGQIVSELRFRDVVQTNFDQLLEADGRAGEECRRLRNLFIVAKVASWLRDLRVPIDTTRLASFALGRWRYPHISLHSLSRTVTHPTRGSHVVQLAGGVAFDVSNPTRTDADRAASGHHGDVAFPLANVVGTTPRLASHRQALKERSPPHFAVDHVRVDGRRMVQLDLGRLLGLQKGALT